MPRKPPDGSLDLTSVIAGIMQAVTDAKHWGNVETAKLADQYATTPALSAFRAPRFTLQDVEVELRFAIDVIPSQGRNASPEIRIILGAEALKAMGSERLQTLRLRISPPNGSA